MAERKKGLGRGLGSLLKEEDLNITADKSTGEKVFYVDINKISPNKEQPRRNFDEEALNELADSIKQIGVIQPITVKSSGDYYIIIAGERRWRASQIAGIKEVPVISVG